MDYSPTLAATFCLIASGGCCGGFCCGSARAIADPTFCFGNFPSKALWLLQRAEKGSGHIVLAPPPVFAKKACEFYAGRLHACGLRCGRRCVAPGPKATTAEAINGQKVVSACRKRLLSFDEVDDFEHRLALPEWC